MIHPLKSAALVLVLMFSFTAQAALDDAKVKSWIDAFGKVQQWSETNAGALEVLESKTDGRTDAQAEEMLKDEPLYKEFKQIVGEYGFDSLQSMKQRTFEIFGAVMEPEMLGQMQAGLAQSQAMLDSDMFDDKMKADMATAIESMKDMLTAAEKTTDADRAAVAPYKEQIMAFIGAE